MADPILDALDDMFPDTATMQAGTWDKYGKFSATGDPETLSVYLSGKIREVTDLSGAKRISSLKMTIKGTPGASVHHVFVLPERFKPRSPQPIVVKPVSDENGAHHEVVFFV